MLPHNTVGDPLSFAGVESWWGTSLCGCLKVILESRVTRVLCRTLFLTPTMALLYARLLDGLTRWNFGRGPTFAVMGAARKREEPRLEKKEFTSRLMPSGHPPT